MYALIFFILRVKIYFYTFKKYKDINILGIQFQFFLLGVNKLFYYFKNVKVMHVSLYNFLMTNKLLKKE